MASQWVTTAAGAHLSGRKAKDTEPEVLLRSALHRMGLRFRLHRRLAKGCTPDLVLVRQRVAVFVDGDFWHGCPVHGRTSFTGPNAALWAEKMRKNRERDTRSTELAVASGYRVIRLWECEVREDATAAAHRVAALAEGLEHGR